MKNKNKAVKSREPKEPTLLRKIIAIHYEQALAKKAMRHLSKLDWSVDFLCHLCAKAAKLTNQAVEITVTSPSKQMLTIRSLDLSDTLYDDNDILNKLDDTQAVNDFIRKHST